MRNITRNFAIFASICGLTSVGLQAQEAQPTPPTPPPIRAKPLPIPGAAVTPVPSANPAVAAPPNGAVPRIAFETPTFNFGRARAGDPVKHTFVFTNTGNAILEIINV